MEKFNLYPGHPFIDRTKGPVDVSEEATVHPQVTLVGPLVVKAGAMIYPGVVIGYEAEHLLEETDWKTPVVIEEGATIRENTVIQRGVIGGPATVVGPQCYIMNRCYVAHNAVLGRAVKMAAGCSLGGFTVLMEGVYMGLNSCAHQKTVVGHHAMVGMGSVVTGDVPPVAKVMGNPARRVGMNWVGLERVGISEHDLESLLAGWTSRWEDRRMGRPRIKDLP